MTGWFTSYCFWFMLKLRSDDCCCEVSCQLCPDAAVSLHVAVLCSSDSGNGYKNKMEDPAQESV